MSPHTEERAPSGRSFAEQRALLSAQSTGRSPRSSFICAAFDPLGRFNKNAQAPRCPFTDAQWSGVRPHASFHNDIGPFLRKAFASAPLHESHASSRQVITALDCPVLAAAWSDDWASLPDPSLRGRMTSMAAHFEFKPFNVVAPEEEKV